jgi:hypothetical protein
MDYLAVLLLHTGLRKVPTENHAKRLEVMMTHGCRKFFEKNAFKAGMDHMYIRRLMGQKSGLEDSTSNYLMRSYWKVIVNM